MPNRTKRTFTRDKSKGKVFEIPCVSCSTETIHKVLSSVDVDGEDLIEDFSYTFNQQFQIVQCQGCKAVSFRKVSANSEDCDSVPGKDGEDEIIYNEHVRFIPAGLQVGTN